MVTHDPIRMAKEATARGDYESAITVLRPLAEAGNRDAQYELGFLALTECELISGREAFSLFMKAAQDGHVEAMYHLATFPDFVSEPFRSPLSEEEAWQWLLLAAEGGCVQAQRDAGASLATGEWREGKIPQNLAGAVEWYRRAAEAGHADAQYNLASMLAEGEGCERDLPAASEWLGARWLAGTRAPSDCSPTWIPWRPAKHIRVPRASPDRGRLQAKRDLSPQGRDSRR
jgi:TPR repeat protein